MAKTKPATRKLSRAPHESDRYVIRTQKFLTGATMVACSCGEVRVFPNARREGKCPRGNPWVCLSQIGLPLVRIALDDTPGDA